MHTNGLVNTQFHPVECACQSNPSVFHCSCPGEFWAQSVEILVLASPNSNVMTSSSTRSTKSLSHSLNSSLMVDDFPPHSLHFPSFISQTHVAQLQAQTQGITAHIIYFGKRLRFFFTMFSTSAMWAVGRSQAGALEFWGFDGGKMENMGKLSRGSSTAKESSYFLFFPVLRELKVMSSELRGLD